MSVNFFGFFFERFRFRCFQGFCRWCALGHAFCNYAQFCCWCVCSSRVGVAALLAFPDAYALPSHSWKAACWASVAFLQFNHYFDVAFSYSGPVADAQPACRSHLLVRPKAFFTSRVVCGVPWPCPWLFLPLLILVSVQRTRSRPSEWHKC